MFGKGKTDFLVIGAQKCGTSSFYRYLTANLMIEAARQKELHYFDLFHDKGERWYNQHFSFSKGSKQGECTPFYLMHPQAAARAKNYNAKFKLIAILRDPAERAWSHYKMNLAHGREKLSFTEALQQEKERIATTNNFEDPNSAFLHFSYQARGCYIDQLEQWLQYFPKEQMMVLSFKDFFNNPWQEIQSVYQFLEIAPLLGTEQYAENLGGAKSPIPDDAQQLLYDYFREPNRQLADKFGIAF